MRYLNGIKERIQNGGRIYRGFSFKRAKHPAGTEESHQRRSPSAQECISYQMPAYKQNRYLLSFAAWKNHIGLYVATKTVLEAYKKELTPYQVSKVTIKFPLDKPLPFDLVKKIVKLRLKEDMNTKKTAKWFCQK